MIDNDKQIFLSCCSSSSRLYLVAPQDAPLTDYKDTCVEIMSLTVRPFCLKIKFVGAQNFLNLTICLKIVKT